MSYVSFERLSQQRNIYRWLYGVGAVLLVLTVVLWWTKTSIDPQRVFWDTVTNSLGTSGVTMTVTSDSGGTKDEQVIQYSLGSTNKLHEYRTTSQGNNVVKTEWIGTPTKTYTRYTDVQSSDRDNLKSVMNVWADSSSAQNGAQLLSQVGLGFALPLGAVPIPIGTVSNSDRADILHQMHTRSLYQVQYNAAKKEHKDGRLLYTYDVAIQPALYLSIMKNFATAVGSKDLDSVDPSQYGNSQLIKLKLTIDAHAKQLVKVVNEEQSYSETYSGHGIPVTVDVPQHPISLSELQKRLSAAHAQ